MKRSAFIISGIAAIASVKSALADGIQVVSNDGTIVAAGSTVNLRQAAGGMQYMDANGNWVQTSSNTIDIVSAGSQVNVDQATQANQIGQDGGSGANGFCQAGFSYIDNDGCLQFCNDQCQMVRFCCKEKKCCR